jgi:predicted nucleic acid-binding protein
LSLAVENLYRPLWSSAILAELRYAEVRKQLTKSVPQAEAEANAARLIERMRSAFDDTEVTHWEPHVGTFGLPDEDDEHVLAAALVGGAGALVTENLKDFPMAKMPRAIQVVTPQEFAADTVRDGRSGGHARGCALTIQVQQIPGAATEEPRAGVRRSWRLGPPAV